jgi:hypothetical protein
MKAWRAMRIRQAIRILSPSVGCVALLVGCARIAPVRATWQPPGTAEWEVLKRKLASMRVARSRASWKGVIQVTMRDPRSGRVVDGRGAIAVSADRAVRLILLGAAGLTMFDAWVTSERRRVALPPAYIVRRGGADDPSDLPVAFLRWWFFTPLEGAMFAAGSTPSGPLWLLRHHDAVVELRSGRCSGGAGLLVATRRARGHEEQVQECRARAAPGAGDSVHYADRSSGLQVDLVVESVADLPPDPEALADPDADRGGT